MASTLQPKSNNGRKFGLKSVVWSLLLFIATLALMGVLLVVVGILLLIGAAVGIVILVFASLLLGSFLVIFKCCCFLVLQLFQASYKGAAAAYMKAQASSRYQSTIKPWLIALLKRFFRWFIPFLLWKIWQWAASSQPQSPSQALPG